MSRVVHIFRLGASMRLSRKALLVTVLGIAAMLGESEPVESETLRDPCGTMYCLQIGDGTCPLDVDGWCAARVGTCPGSNACIPQVQGPPCPSPFTVAIYCGEGET